MSLTLAFGFLLLVVVLVATGSFIAGRAFGRGMTSTRLGGIGRIQEIGEYVALRTECRDVGRARDKDSWFGRGRLVLITCEMIVEHRFNLRELVIRPTVDSLDLIVPEATITVSHGDVTVEHLQSGTFFGIPVRRPGPEDLTRLLTEARTNMDANQERRNDYLTGRARDSVRVFLLGLAAHLAPGTHVRIVFDGPSGQASDEPPALPRATRPLVSVAVPDAGASLPKILNAAPFA